MSCGDNKNPLQRTGISQQERFLPALKDSYIKIDERGYAEWIVFATEFAAYLKYYGLNNTEAGDWKPFFEKDISAILGTLAVQNVDNYRLAITERFTLLRSDDYESNSLLLKNTLGALFSGIATLAKSLDSYIERLPDSVSLKQNILNLVKLKLQPALQKLIAYYKGGLDLSLIKEKDIADWKVLNLAVTKAATIFADGLSTKWIKGSATTWADYYDSIAADESVYGDTTLSVFRQINHAVNHNLFSGLFDQFLMVYARIVKDAEQMLLKTLTEWNDHPAHMTLFLTFLKLFRYSQDHINTLTGRHLDLYYKEVLRMKPEPVVPDKAHILVELSKPTDEYLLKKDTLFRAGKDSGGKDIYYSLLQDTLFNKAKVAKLMALYKGLADDEIGTVNNEGRFFAASVVNSADGLGGELKSDYGEWHPFANKEFANGDLKAINTPAAAIGFAVASHHLYLAEGSRKVMVKFVTATGSDAFPASLDLACFLTTEKGWYEVPVVTKTTGQTNEGTPVNATVLQFIVAADVAPIVNYNAEVHGGVYDCDLPILAVYLKNENDAAYTYEELKSIAISKVEIEVQVGLNTDGYTQEGVKQLVMMTDTGIVDPTKPFLPFGTRPEKGSSLVIGSPEIFSKKNAQIRLNIEWDKFPTDYWNIDYGSDPTYFPSVDLKYLMGGKWSDNVSPLSFEVMSYYYPTVKSPYSGYINLPAAVISNDMSKLVSYDTGTTKGFIRVSLKDGFGHAAYQTALTDYLIKIANKTTPAPTFPNEPYTPTIRSLYISYKAAVISNLTTATKTAFENRDVRFFHIYPFGAAEQHAYIDEDLASVPLVPQFTHVIEGVAEPTEETQYINGCTPVTVTVSNDTPPEHAAEFYIGFENLVAGQSVQVLFQVLDGTSDPLLDKPEKHVTWSYLSNNKWQTFTDQDIVDNTAQLVRSGIISFVIPTDATTGNSILPTGYLWIMASVNIHAGAVCKLLSVDAQAAVVSFQNNSNAADILNAALPASTIAKLKEPLAAVKKVAQPYATYGGRGLETTEQFYTRVSERLRHKDRAITIWDYEHLVLKNFPQIHAVKCLNHTKSDGSCYNEMLPGNVTIITIPSLENRNDANPLRPFTNQNILESIEEFIKKRISCHVNLYVRHPQFEEVRFDFQLKLVKGLEFNYYKKLLQQEITEFLSPWAYGKSNDISFGGKVHKSVVINFIEERSYVDYITDVKMYHYIDETSTDVDTDMIVASKAKSILVSVQPTDHTIGEIKEATTAAVAEDCTDEWNAGKSQAT